MSDERTAEPAPASAPLGAVQGNAEDDIREGELLSRLKLIEDQPLETRAEAYAHIHDELRTALDDADRRRGDQQGDADRRRGDQQGDADRQGGR